MRVEADDACHCSRLMMHIIKGFRLNNIRRQCRKFKANILPLLAAFLRRRVPMGTRRSWESNSALPAPEANAHTQFHYSSVQLEPRLRCHRVKILATKRDLEAVFGDVPAGSRAVYAEPIVPRDGPPHPFLSTAATSNAVPTIGRRRGAECVRPPD